MKRRSTSRGTVLPIVLLLAAMMLVTASAWLQASLGTHDGGIARACAGLSRGGQRIDPMQPNARRRASSHRRARSGAVVVA